MTRMRRRMEGFTLIEALSAISIGSGVLATATWMLTAILAHGARADRAFHLAREMERLQRSFAADCRAVTAYSIRRENSAELTLITPDGKIVYRVDGVGGIVRTLASPSARTRFAIAQKGQSVALAVDGQPRPIAILTIARGESTGRSQPIFAHRIETAIGSLHAAPPVKSVEPTQ